MHVKTCILGAAMLLGLAAPAHANCDLPGKWNMFTLAGYPQGDAVLTCTLTIANNGAVVGSCRSFPTNNPAGTANLGGSLRANTKCRLTGTLRSGAFPPLTVRDGLVRGNTATAIGTRGTGPFTHVRLMQFMR